MCVTRTLGNASAQFRSLSALVHARVMLGTLRIGGFVPADVA
jgi:hypothetical protein